MLDLPCLAAYCLLLVALPVSIQVRILESIFRVDTRLASKPTTSVLTPNSVSLALSLPTTYLLTVLILILRSLYPLVFYTRNTYPPFIPFYLCESSSTSLVTSHLHFYDYRCLTLISLLLRATWISHIIGGYCTLVAICTCSASICIRDRRGSFGWFSPSCLASVHRDSPSS